MDCAIAVPNEQEAWLAQNRAEIETSISEGYASAQRGELVKADEVRSRLAERKRAWLDAHQRE